MGVSSSWDSLGLERPCCCVATGGGGRSGCVEDLVTLPELELPLNLVQTPALWQLGVLGWNNGVIGVHPSVPAAVVSIDQQRFPVTACAL